MAKRQKSIIHKIKGTDWTFILESSVASYTRKHGKDSEAITYTNEKEVFFSPSGFSTNTLRHELCHIFVCESHTNSSPDFTKDDMEDLACEIFGEHGPLICYQADYIYAKLRSKS